MATRLRRYLPSKTLAGADAASPWAIPLEGWKQVALRAWKEAGNDNIGLVAAGVAFYGFLALVPLLGAIVLSYGIVAEPKTVILNMQSLTSVMPKDAAKLIGDQLMNVVTTSGGKKGFGLLLALALALYGARNGAGSIVTALNIAYEEHEKRSFFRLNLLTLGMTAVGVVVAIVALVAIAALGHLEALIPGAPSVVLVIGKLLSYLALILAGAAGAAALYRFGPSRTKPQWSWLTPGSIFSALMWLLLTAGFGLYVANFGNYNATYGSLGAVVIMLTWLYLSSYVLLFGAELNAELEHQTAADSTHGAEKPLGQRGAWVADHVATSDASEEAGKPKGLGDAPPPAKPADPPLLPQASFKGNYLVSRASSRLVSAVGLPKIGMVSSALSTFGLATLRKRGGTKQGAALLIVAAGLALLMREKTDEVPAGEKNRN